MARPDQSEEKRKELLPVVAKVFAEFGYRRTTTAELARSCAVRENILYRLWPNKKAMFLAAIEYVYDLSMETWHSILVNENDASSSAERVLAYEARHHGEFGLYRIVFAGLSETDDPEIRGTLKKMFARFHGFIQSEMKRHGQTARREVGREKPGDDVLAWAIVALGTMANITREIGLLNNPKRQRLISDVGRLLLDECVE